MSSSSKEAITLRIDPATCDELDALARATALDRTSLLNEAASAYLDANRFHLVAIEAGLRQADAGEFASEEEVARAYAAFR